MIVGIYQYGLRSMYTNDFATIVKPNQEEHNVIRLRKNIYQRIIVKPFADQKRFSMERSLSNFRLEFTYE